MTTKRAFITGITGQDGSYLAELLLRKGYEVHGLVRRSSSFNTGRLDAVYDDPRLRLHYGDVSDFARLRQLLDEVQPDEVYHLAAQSHVRVSFDEPVHTADVVALGTLRLLEAVRQSGRPRVYVASTSELFGDAPPPQSEATPFRPRNPYAIAKLAAHWHAVNYREAYGVPVICGILFNHESPRRGATFLTRKVTLAAARIKLGLQDKLRLGNLSSKRDWGYAPDYVEAMWTMLQQDEPDDYVVATGESHTAGEFVEAAFGALDLRWQEHVEIDPRYLRPTEVDDLCGDASKARDELGWVPSVGFEALVEIMVGADLTLARKEARK